MLPLVANNAIPTPPPVVNTMLPGATIAHVPYDNVAPSVSSAEIDNNASGNNNAAAAAPEPPPADNLSMAEAFANYLGGNAATIPNINAQATFLAQLIGQDITIPPETAGILVQYEKLDAYSQVKYKPSNAQKPQAAPSNVFSRILQEEHAAPVVPAAAPPANAPVGFQWVKAQGAPAPRPVVSKAAKGAEAYAESAGRIAVSANTLAESA